MKRIIGIILLTLAASANSQAQDQSSDSEIKFSCKEDATAETKYFPDILKSAKTLNQAICDGLLVPTRSSVTDGFPRDDVSEFGQFVKEKVNGKLGNVGLDMLPPQLDFFAATLTSGEFYPLAMPILNIKKSAEGPHAGSLYFFTGNQINQGKLTSAIEGNCQAISELNPTCSDVLKDLGSAIFPYQANANAFTAYDTRVKLNALGNDWDSYFDLARTQTFFDIVVTTFFEKDHFDADYLVGPPNQQWFVLHPNLVMEYADDAPDGEKFKPALSIEWLGMNYWQDSFLGIPFGLSLTSVYSDRPGVKSVGHGVTLYFDNKYMLGYANHDGQDGFYVSMDLLKLFESKKKQVDHYRDKLKKYRDDATKILN